MLLLHRHLQVMHNFLPSAVKFHYQVRVGRGGAFDKWWPTLSCLNMCVPCNWPSN